MSRLTPKLTLLLGLLIASRAFGAPFVFSGGSPDGRMAMASRPAGFALIETETADDFFVTNKTIIDHASFTGLVPSGASISQVVVKVYRIFPLDSSNPPSGNVPTRSNSPSDVAFVSRDSQAGEISFTTSVINANFSAANSVVNGIHPKPTQTTGGEGPVSGQEVTFTVTFNAPLVLLPGHYFFVPEVLQSPGTFLWLSAALPAAPPVAGDLQVWIRNTSLDPDWLRVGTDIVGSGTFNASFSLSGITVPPAGDFNGDGKADVLWRNTVSGSNSEWLMSGPSVAVSASFPSVADSNFKVAGLGDFQGDGKTDVLWRNSATGANVVWLIDGTSVAVTAVLPTVADPNWIVAGVGDFQGDGKADILWRNVATGDDSVWLMNGTSVAVSASLPSVPDANFKVVGIGDFQGDGKDDVLWRNSSTGANVLWLMNGPAVAASALLPAIADPNWTVAGVGDLQGDGKADIVWRNTATGDDALWMMDGLTVAATASLPTVSDLNWQIVRLADFQGDGKADILWRNTATGDNAQWLMNGPAVAVGSSLPAVPDTTWKIAGPP